MKKAGIAFLAVAVMAMLPVTPAAADPAPATEKSASASAAAFRLIAGPRGGARRVKVARILRFRVVCTRDCRVKARFKLITPVGSDTVKGGRSLKAFTKWQTGMILTRTGRNLLKRNYLNSRIVARFIATDVLTGKRIVRNRSYGFRK